MQNSAMQKLIRPESLCVGGRRHACDRVESNHGCERSGSNESTPVFPFLATSLDAAFRSDDDMLVVFSGCRSQTPLRVYRAVAASANAVTTGLPKPTAVAMGASSRAGPCAGISISHGSLLRWLYGMSFGST
jgi:hypothetical protein